MSGAEQPAPLALTLGEPAGIGPDLLEPARAALAAAGEVFFVIGDPALIPGPVAEISAPDQAAGVMARAVPVLARDWGAPRRPGRPDPRHARHVIAAIEEAVALTRAGAAAAVVTNPIHKHALQAGGGFAFPGHTEFLAHLAGLGPQDVVMMLACSALRVVPATIHIPLAEVPRRLSPDLLERVIRLTDAGLRRDFALAAPRIAVAGLNPHAGEDGAMGHEELDWIVPLIRRLADAGLAVSGPLPADTMFHPAARARYDVAIGMYHDQALIPIKTLDFARGVNVTLGLPFVRTSPDHGTAFDIAGTNRADPRSLIAALEMARAMARARAGAPEVAAGSGAGGGA